MNLVNHALLNKSLDQKNSGEQLGFGCQLAIVHPNQSIRSLMIRSFKDEGYLNIQSFSDLESAKQYIEAEKIDWLWTPLLSKAKITALHLLEMTCANDSLQNLRVSIFFDEDEAEFALVAFELGVMSWHPAQKSQVGFQHEIKAILNLLSKHHHLPTLVAADQLDRLLRHAKCHEQRRKLFKSVAELYPNKAFSLLGHAKIEFELGNRGAGLRAIKLAKSQSLPGWQELATTHIGQSQDLDKERLYDIESYVIVEPDESVHNHIESLMKPFGAKRVHRFTDGEKALKWLQNRKPPDLIIQEWKIPDVSGSNFLQRMRHSDAKDVPVLVVSSLLKKQDISILKEMGVANAVQKPLIDHEFVSSLTHTLREYAEPTSLPFLERKIRNLLESGKRGEAQIIIRSIEKDKTTPLATRCFVQALLTYFDGNYSKTKELLVESLNEGADAMRVLPMFARTLVRLRDFSAAAKCYEKAQELSPQNIYRLFELAETYQELGEQKGVDDALHRATRLDPNNPEITVMKARIALSKGNINAASSLVQSLKNKQSLIADMNNAGVMYVKTGSPEKGIDLYEKTLLVLGKTDPSLSARVSYNLALAQAKSGEYIKSRRSLESFMRQRFSDMNQTPKNAETKKVISTTDGHYDHETDSRLASQLSHEAEVWQQLVKKASSLHVRLSHAISTQTPLGLAVRPASQASINESFWNRMEGQSDRPRSRFMSSKNAEPGERCCHLIFETPIELVRKLGIKKILSNPLIFSPRVTIEKGTSAMGIDFEGFDIDV